MLNELGMPLTDRSILMGHTSTKVTQTFYTFNDMERIKKTCKKYFKVSHW